MKSLPVFNNFFLRFVFFNLIFFTLVCFQQLQAASTIKHAGITNDILYADLYKKLDNTSIVYYTIDGQQRVRAFTNYSSSDGSIQSCNGEVLYNRDYKRGYEINAWETLAVGPFGEEDASMTMFHWSFDWWRESATASNGISFIKAGETQVTFLRAYLQDLGLPFNYPLYPNPTTNNNKVGINYWSGGEINQLTGEIYLSGGELQTFGARADTSRYQYMIINPKTGEWRKSKRVIPLSPSDAILETSYIASDMAIDAEGNLYTLVSNPAQGTHRWKDYFLVRIIPAGNNEDWTYNIVKTLDSFERPSGAYIYGMTFLNGKLYATIYGNLHQIDPISGGNKFICTTSGLSFDLASANLAPMLRGKVYLDDNGDGALSANETTGIPDVTIELYDENNKYIGEQQTAANGDYSFIMPFVYDKGNKKTFYVRMKQPRIEGANSGITWASGGRFEWAGKKHPGNNTATVICYNGDVTQKLIDGGGSCYGARADGIDGSSRGVLGIANYYAKVEMQTERAVVHVNFALAPVDRSDAPHNMYVDNLHATGSTRYQLGEVAHMMLSNKVKMGEGISADLTGSLSSSYATKDLIGDDSFMYLGDDNVTWHTVQGKTFDNNVTYKFRVTISNNSLPATSTLTLGIWTNWDASRDTIVSDTLSNRIRYEVLPLNTNEYIFDYAFGGSSSNDKTYNTYFRVRLSSSDIESSINPVRGSAEANSIKWVLDGEVEDYWKKVWYKGNVVLVGNYRVVNQNVNKNAGDIISDDDSDKDNALYTQISNKDFDAKLIYTSADLKTVADPINKETVGIDFINSPSYSATDTLLEKEQKCQDASIISSIGDVAVTGSTTSINNIKISKVAKSGTFRIKYKDGGSDVKYACSLDSFSVRPASYDIKTVSIKLLGGKNEEVKILATDINNATTIQYNQTSANIQTNDTKLNLPAGCSVTYTVDDFKITSLDDFVNGVANGTVFYNNIGNISTTFYDKDWTTVDIIKSDCVRDDANNTHNSKGKVGCNIVKTLDFIFTPKEFQNTLTVKNFDNGNFTYISSNKDMSASILMDIKAVLFDNKTATNYQKDCWSYNTDISAELEKTPYKWSKGNAKNRINYYAGKNSAILSTLGEKVTVTIDSNIYINGTAKDVGILFNFDRETDKFENPFVVRNTDFNITKVIDTNGTEGEDFTNRAINSNATFFYGKAHSVDYIGTSPITATMRYEVYCDLGCSASEHGVLASGKNPSYVNWYLNNMHDNASAGNMTNIVQKTSGGGITVNPNFSINMINGRENIRLTHASPPHADDIMIETQSWLIYDKYNSAATKNKFNVEFIGAGGGWAGEGVVSENTSVIDRKIGRVIDANASNRSKQKIDW